MLASAGEEPWSLWAGRVLLLHMGLQAIPKQVKLLQDLALAGVSVHRHRISCNVFVLLIYIDLDC